MIRTEAEIQAFTEKSVVRDTLYHGTTFARGFSIARNGFELDPSNSVHLFRTRKNAEDWAKQKISLSEKSGIPIVISAKVKVDKLLEAGPSRMHNLIISEEHRLHRRNLTIAEYLVLNGYDAAALDFPYRCKGDDVMVLDPNNILPIDYEQI